MSSLSTLLRTEVPRDYRSYVLSGLAGSVLSFPVGLLLALTIRPIEPPEWFTPYYLSAVLTAFLILPLWSHFICKTQPVLRKLGLGIFLLGLLFFLWGLLFPG